jgi:hypothetical protein
MRFVSLAPALVALFLANSANAQEWGEYVNRQEFFTVNFPGEPTMTQVPYTTAKGTKLTAHVFTAAAAANSILAGTYSMTVVDYASAPAELGTAIAEAAKSAREKGTAKYDEPGNVDRIKTQRMTIETKDNHRIMSEILVQGTRLYIVQADTAINVPPPAQFQASVQILDEKGERIRYNADGVTGQR